jgi:hypothetical protein
MTKQEELVTQFYSYFSNLDAEGMVECYHDEVSFQDPAFGNLIGKDAKDMWRMLIEKGGDNLEVTMVNVSLAENEICYAEWVASYYYGPQQRRVINFINASFEFKDGLIINHKDHFNLWRWARQAIGFNGLLLGWTPWFRKQVRKQSLSFLKRYQDKHASV